MNALLIRGVSSCVISWSGKVFIRALRFGCTLTGTLSEPGRLRGGCLGAIRGRAFILAGWPTVRDVPAAIGRVWDAGSTTVFLSSDAPPGLGCC